jgi:hypothetical protein
MAGKRDELVQHIQRLCERHGIEIVERRSRGGWARKRGRTISIKPVKTERMYIIALHEIGHIIGPNRSGQRLEQETAAWDFVLEQSIVTLSDGSYAFMLGCLDGYLHRATHSRRAMVIPEQGHRFWKLTRRSCTAFATETSAFPPNQEHREAVNWRCRLSKCDCIL